MMIKMHVRNAVWRIRGLTVRNPPAPEHARSILFVCQGNICRSPFAAEVARRLLPEGVVCLSAGFRVKVDTRSPPAAVEAAETRGVSLHDHRATPLTQSMMAGADIVFVMEAWHLALLRSTYRDQRRKIMLLSLCDPTLGTASTYDRFHIADPYGKPPEVFDTCFGRLERTIAALAQRADSCAA
jgi:protein-tyrosine-phosphatase